MGYSPDRVDALVWGVSHLFLDASDGHNVEDFYRQEHARVVANIKGGGKVVKDDELTVRLHCPRDTRQASGLTGRMYTEDAFGVITVHADDAPALRRAGFVDVEQDTEEAA